MYTHWWWSYKPEIFRGLCNTQSTLSINKIYLDSDLQLILYINFYGHGRTLFNLHMLRTAYCDCLACWSCKGECRLDLPHLIFIYLSIYLSIYLWLYSPFVGPWPLFHFLNPYTVSRTPWAGDRPVARLLPTHRTTQTQNKRTQTSMPWVGFEPTIPAFERAKTVHGLRPCGHCDRQLSIYREL
jgi:hypothetical protein